MKIEDLSRLELSAQLLFIRDYLPDAWDYLNGNGAAQLPKFDDDDEMIGGNDNE